LCIPEKEKIKLKSQQHPTPPPPRQIKYKMQLCIPEEVTLRGTRHDNPNMLFTMYLALNANLLQPYHAVKRHPASVLCVLPNTCQVKTKCFAERAK